MKKSNLLIMALAGLTLVSCGQKNKKDATVVESVTTTETKTTDQIVKSSFSDPGGKTLEISFNKVDGTATAVLNGEKIALKRDTTASGVRMHSDKYEYEEWQGNIVIKKEGKVIYNSEDSSAAKPAISFKDNTATLKIGDETITLNAAPTASGIKYNNDTYTYEEWQGRVVLKKNGEVVFDNKPTK